MSTSKHTIPDNIPTPPEDATYEGTLADHEGRLYGFVFEEGRDKRWVGPSSWDGMKNVTPEFSANWHFAAIARATGKEPQP